MHNKTWKDTETPQAMVETLNNYSCMGIRYAKLFEAAKSMFKS